MALSVVYGSVGSAFTTDRSGALPFAWVPLWRYMTGKIEPPGSLADFETPLLLRVIGEAELFLSPANPFQPKQNECRTGQLHAT